MAEILNLNSTSISNSVADVDVLNPNLFDVMGGVEVNGVEVNADDLLVQRIIHFLKGQPPISNRQAQLMDGLLECRLAVSQDPVTEDELLGIYKMITEVVLPISLPV